MAMTKMEKINREIERRHLSYDQKEKKVVKKMRKAFSKLNKKSCYSFYSDKKSKSFENCLDFFTCVEILCQYTYGRKDFYKKYEVSYIINRFFINVSDRGRETLDELNKVLKKGKVKKFTKFPFNGLFKGKHFMINTESNDDF